MQIRAIEVQTGDHVEGSVVARVSEFTHDRYNCLVELELADGRTIERWDAEYVELTPLEDCPSCGGAGEVGAPTRDPRNYEPRPCPRCEGDGTVLKEAA